MKKTWILLLILCGFAMAQRPYNNQRSGYAQNILWRDLHPSTQDSIRAAIIDSITALSADGVTILNDGTFKQRVVNDTTIAKTLGAATDSIGTVINVKQLSSSNFLGGGYFQLVDSTDFKASFGSAVPDKGSILDAAGPDRIWVRQDIFFKHPINPYWYGAKGDNSNDDTAELQAAIDAAETLNIRYVYLPNGVFKISAALDIPSRNFRFEGMGNNQNPSLGNGGSVIVQTASGVSGIECLTSVQDLVIRNIHIQGTGKSGATKDEAGLYIGSNGGSHGGDFITIENVTVRNFYYGIRANVANSSFRWNRIDSCVVGHYGTAIFLNSNSYDHDFGVLTDTCYSFTAGSGARGVTIRNGEWGDFLLVAYIHDGTSVTFDGGNYERCDGNEFVKLTTNSRVVMDGDVTFGWSAGEYKPAIKLSGAIAIINSMKTTNQTDTATVILETTNAQVYSDIPIRVENTNGQRMEALHLWSRMQDAAITTPDSTIAGRISYWHRDDDESRLQFTYRRRDGDYGVAELAQAAPQYSTNGSTFGYVTGMQAFVGRKGFTTSGGDSTIVTVTVPAYLTSQYYSILGTVKTSNSTRQTYATLKNEDAATGVFTFIVWHVGYSGTENWILSYQINTRY